MTENSANGFRTITRSELDARLATEKGRLSPEFQAFLQSLGCAIFAVPCFRSEHYGIEHVFVIARSGQKLLIFDDVEDEFALGPPDSDGVLRSWGLCGDLIDALRVVQRLR